MSVGTYKHCSGGRIRELERTVKCEALYRVVARAKRWGKNGKPCECVCVCRVEEECGPGWPVCPDKRLLWSISNVPIHNITYSLSAPGSQECILLDFSPPRCLLYDLYSHISIHTLTHTLHTYMCIQRYTRSARYHISLRATYNIYIMRI